MHIPENYLSPETCAVMTAAAVPVWAHAVRKVKVEVPKEKMTMLGTGAALSFLVMMLNVPLIGGTTGHAVGGVLIALIFGPHAACLGVSVALLIQAVIFGDGGILAFGANCFNMAFILPYSGYYIYKLITGQRRGANLNDVSPMRRYIGAAVGSYVGLNLAALCAAIEFGVQPMLFADEAGNALYCPYDLSISIPAMTIPHLVVAGIVEAAFTVAVFAFVTKVSPNLITTNVSKVSGSDENKSFRPVFLLLAIMVAITPLGLLATGTAWGEWGADEIAEVTTNGKALGYTPSGLADGWSLNAIMPDYAIEGANEVLIYILSAILGVALLIILFKMMSVPMKERKS